MHTNVPTENEAVLIIGFGSATERGLDIYRKLEMLISERYPLMPVVWAFTSELFNQDLQEAGEKIYSLPDALDVLDAQGITRVSILPLYVVHGSAYGELEEELKQLFSRNRSHLKSFALACPLLHEARDADVVSNALLESLPDEDECPERVLFMGHGSSSEAGNAAYEDVDDLLDRTCPGARLALLSGDSFETLLAEWGDACEGERVLLRPFFFTIGCHSLRDLAGKDSHSWKSRLEAMGYECEVELISLGDLPAIRDLLIEHLQDAIEER